MAVLLAAHSESKIAETTGVDIRNTPPLAPHTACSHCVTIVTLLEDPLLSCLVITESKATAADQHLDCSGR
jgi:hypothetical protein